MNRKHFLLSCQWACLGLAGHMLHACIAQQSITAQLEGTDLIIPANAFLSRENQSKYRNYVIVEHADLRYPICVFRYAPEEYSALLMQCTHQGAELQVFGDRLECPAHGSIFTNHGEVQGGPASDSLRRFPIVLNGDHLLISLKKHV